MLRPRLDQGSISPTCLRKAFTHADQKSVKIQSSLQYVFALLGSVHIKTSSKMLKKLTPQVAKRKNANTRSFTTGLPGPKKLKRINLAISSFKKGQILKTDKRPNKGQISFQHFVKIAKLKFIIY